MKTLFRSISIACLVLCAQWAMAQASISHFYSDNQNGYTIDALPLSTDYIAAGTVYDPSGIGNNNLHIVHYDQNGNMLNSYLVGEAAWDDRSVKVIGLSPTTYAVVCYAQSLLGVLQGEIRVLRMDISGNILAQQRYSVSSGLTFRSLYPLDAIFDRPNRQYAICGTAVNGSAHSPTTSKEAFVLTIDALTLAVNNMMMYSTAAGPYGIATKIKKTQDGFYYLTGSENMNGPTGTTMYIRNMTVEPSNLKIVQSFPLTLTSFLPASANSVDVYETRDAYCVLVNSQQINNWGIIRVDKRNMQPVGRFEQNPHTAGLAYSFIPGNTSTEEAVVAGMSNPSVTNAVPFLSFIDLGIVPGNIYQRTEYPTVIGNTGFWTLGNFYAGNNGYPLPSFLHEFAARLDNTLNTNMGLITPILGPGISPSPSPVTYLNTKIIPTNPLGKSPCPVNTNTGVLLQTLGVGTTGITTSNAQTATAQTSNVFINKYAPNAKALCTPPDNYYKLGNTGSSEETSALVYPNPTQGTIYLNLSSYGDAAVSVRLFDLTGKHIATVYEGKSSGKIDCQLPSDIAKGLYLLSIEAPGKDKRIEKLSID